jgi:SAM-dependent methyltransferase
MGIAAQIKASLRRVHDDPRTPPLLRAAMGRAYQLVHPPAKPAPWAPPAELGNCRICGGALAAHIEQGGPLFARFRGLSAQLAACEACGHKQFVPDLRDEDLADVYGGAYWGSDGVDRRLYTSLYEAPENGVANGLARTLADWGMTSRARVHEFGCGSGLTMHHIAKLGFDASGSDWAPDAIAFANERGFQRATVENANTVANWEKASLDVIFTSHWLEHIPDPISSLKRFVPLLRPDGLLVMLLPNGDGIVNRRLGMSFDPFYYFPHHIHYFSVASLIETVERAGYQVLSIRTTQRYTPGVLSAATGTPPGADLEAEAGRLARNFLTEELEIVAAPVGTGRTPRANVAAARALGGRELPPEPAVEAGDAWANAFYKGGGGWTAGAEPDQGPATEVLSWSPDANCYYWDDARIGDNYLEDGARHHPVLTWRAPRDGNYTLSLGYGLRMTDMGSVWLKAEGGGFSLDEEVLTYGTTRQTATLSMRRGETFKIRVRSPEGQIGQRCLVFARIG